MFFQPRKRFSALIDISADDDLSEAIRIPEGFALCSLRTPSNFTNASITFQVSDDGGTTYTQLRHMDADGVHAAYTIAAAVASQTYSVDPAVFTGFDHLKVATSAAQITADKTIILNTRSFA